MDASAGRELKKLPPPWGELMCWRARATCWWEVNLCVRFGRSPFCSGQRRGKCALRGLPSQAKLLARADQSRATSPPEPPGLTRLVRPGASSRAMHNTSTTCRVGYFIGTVVTCLLATIRSIQRRSRLSATVDSVPRRLERAFKAQTDPGTAAAAS